MITPVHNAASYDWRTWLIGSMRSVIAGGAGGVSGCLGSMGIDPEHFNLTNGLGHLAKLMACVFFFCAFVHLMMFLCTHPSPDLVAMADGLAAGNPHSEGNGAAKAASA